MLAVVALSGCGDDSAPTRSKTIAALSVAEAHACLLTRDDEVWCWGWNVLGGVGVQSSDGSQVHSRPVRVAVPAAHQLVATDGETCIELTGGGVQCWGGIPFEPETARLRPRRLPDGRLVGRGGDACALAGDGVWCWGTDEANRLSPGTPAADLGSQKQTEPHLLDIPGRVNDIALGKFHSCVLLADGTVHCWGATIHGTSNSGNDGIQPTPRRIPGLEDVTAIAAGSSHDCALRRDGTVWCWGRAAEGQIGVGRVPPLKVGEDYSVVPTPTRAKGLRSVRVIAAAAERTCAIRTDGSLWCWGDNKRGQLGDGTSIDRHVPVRVGLRHVVSVGMARGYTCALLASGEVWCWGENERGVLGHGGVEDSARPLRAWPIDRRHSERPPRP